MRNSEEFLVVFENVQQLYVKVIGVDNCTEFNNVRLYSLKLSIVNKTPCKIFLFADANVTKCKQTMYLVKIDQKDVSDRGSGLVAQLIIDSM